MISFNDFEISKLLTADQEAVVCFAAQESFYRTLGICTHSTIRASMHLRNFPQQTDTSFLSIKIEGSPSACYNLGKDDGGYSSYILTIKEEWVLLCLMQFSLYLNKLKKGASVEEFLLASEKCHNGVLTKQKGFISWNVLWRYMG